MRFWNPVSLGAPAASTTSSLWSRYSNTFTEAPGFVVLGGEVLHHHVAAQGFLKDLVDLCLAILRVAAGAAYAPAHTHGRQHYGGHYNQADQREPRIVAEEHVQEKDRREKL